MASRWEKRPLAAGGSQSAVPITNRLTFAPVEPERLILPQICPVIAETVLYAQGLTAP
jgi:hypothetical protein